VPAAGAGTKLGTWINYGGWVDGYHCKIYYYLN